MSWRDIARASDTRTTIASVLPRCGVGHTSPIVLPPDAQTAALLQACFSSFAFDYIVRQKLAGTHLTYGYLCQLPVPPIAAFNKLPGGPQWVINRAVELSYTSNDISSYARDLGYTGPPFRWDESRRENLRAELDAAFFHLFGLSRTETDYIMETFPVIKRMDEAKFGNYRTKSLILQYYDQLDSPLHNVGHSLQNGKGAFS